MDTGFEWRSGNIDGNAQYAEDRFQSVKSEQYNVHSALLFYLEKSYWPTQRELKEYLLTL